MHSVSFHKIPVFLIGILISIFFFHSCIDENISTDPSLKLKFSKDTLFFDTIFTTIGSSTAKIKIYNPNSKNIQISALGLAGGSASFYNLNVDGAVNQNNQFTNVELRANDSLFVFVEVKVDPLNVNSPTLIEDSIVFLTNGNHQAVKLIAYGQDMIVFKNKKIYNDTILTADKPYLIYGDLVVDTARTITLKPGCKMYFHDGASFVIHGNLIAEGKPDSLILLRGDRTDRMFDEVPYNYVSNQWGGILLLYKEGNHKISFAKMNSGYVGVYFSNNDRNFRPKLDIKNTRIHNFLKYGLVVQNGDVNVVNTEISNTGAYSVYLNGGKHTFIHSTIANYFNSTNILMQPSGKEGNAALMIMELNKTIPMETIFKNCIVSGNSSSEFEILSRFADRYNGVFSNSYIKKVEPNPIPPMFSHITWYNSKDTVFVNSYFDREKLAYYNFNLDSVSPARDIGDYEVASHYPFDLNGNDRLADGKPDAGAYEWQPKVK